MTPLDGHLGVATETGRWAASPAPASDRQFDRRAAAPYRPRRGRAVLPFAGPAVMVATAYMDPGNFAMNIQAGARYGYALLWVVLLANLVAMLFQALSAKLGIVTGRNLAELCREHLPRPATRMMWVIGEFAAMATDLAELLGGAIGLALILHLPILAGMAITAVVTCAILLLDRAGFRPTEIVIAGFVGVIALCYGVELVVAPVDWGGAAVALAVPTMPDGAAIAIAVGIVGATVMPHALFLHSGLTQTAAPGGGSPAHRRAMLRASHRNVIVALGIAGLVNLSMVLLAAAAFHGHADSIAEIDAAYRALGPLLGATAAAAFLISLLSSSISSSVVGTLAGQVIMQGFVGYRIPVWARRLVTMLPAFAVIAFGIDPTRALVLSQIVLRAWPGNGLGDFNGL